MGREKWVQKSLFPSPNRGRIPLGMLPSCPLGLLARSVPRSAPAWQLCVFPVTMATLPGPPGHRAGGPSLGEVSMGKASVGNTPQVWNFHPGQGWGGTGGSPSSCPCFNPHQESPKGTGTAQGGSVSCGFGVCSAISHPYFSPSLQLWKSQHTNRGRKPRKF